MNKLKIALALVVATLSFGLISAPAMAATCPDNTLRPGESVGSLAECNVEPDSGNGLIGTIQVIINVVLTVLGLVAVIMIIFGGVQYTTSSGDATKVTKAKNTILYAVVGLIIALLAFAIVNFVLNNVFDGSGSSSSGTPSSSSSTTTP